MSDNIELVIKIPEKIYKHILSTQFYIPGLRSGKSLLEEILKAIRTGTPLPKGHGRLGDLDKLEKDMENGIMAGLFEEGYERYTRIFSLDDCVERVQWADTIIEADKEKQE